MSPTLLQSCRGCDGCWGGGDAGGDARAAVESWMEGAAERTGHFSQMLTEMRDAAQVDFATLSVALQEIRRLAQD